MPMPLDEFIFDDHSELGERYRYKFANGYGASVVMNQYTYGGLMGLWELAVLRFDPIDSDRWELCYTTPVTNDVLGYLNETELKIALKRIQEL